MIGTVLYVFISGFFDTQKSYSGKRKKEPSPIIKATVHSTEHTWSERVIFSSETFRLAAQSYK